MAIDTQGTDVFFIDPATKEVVDAGCVTSIDGIDAPKSQMETTCLKSKGREYKSGLAEPGTATLGINADPNDAAHIRLHQLYTEGKKVSFAVGWSDGQGVVPTVNADGEFELPATRTWIEFDANISAFPFNFALNDVVKTTISTQISGLPVWTPKA